MRTTSFLRFSSSCAGTSDTSCAGLANPCIRSASSISCACVFRQTTTRLSFPASFEISWMSKASSCGASTASWLYTWSRVTFPSILPTSTAALAVPCEFMGMSRFSHGASAASCCSILTTAALFSVSFFRYPRISLADFRISS